MALNAMKRIGRLATYLPPSRNILCSSSKSPFRFAKNTSDARTITRSLFFLSRNRNSSNGPDHVGSISVASPWSNMCSCGCNMHTKGDKELAAFLEEEIATESKMKRSDPGQELEGFLCKFNAAEVTLTKKFNSEVITIKANVNHSVDSEASDADPSEAKEETPEEMKAKPDFTVEIAKGTKILSFECRFAEMFPGDKDGAYNDSFEISEVAVYDGEYGDTTYSVAGDIMDGYLYDLLMNYLDERGISSDLADKLIVLFTSYEHRLYIGLLQNMKKFVEK